MGGIYNWSTRTDPDTSLSTTLPSPGYPDRKFLDEHLRESEHLKPEDIELAMSQEWSN